jgi:hypothetical protein
VAEGSKAWRGHGLCPSDRGSSRRFVSTGKIITEGSHSLPHLLWKLKILPCYKNAKKEAFSIRNQKFNFYNCRRSDR